VPHGRRRTLEVESRWIPWIERRETITSRLVALGFVQVVIDRAGIAGEPVRAFVAEFPDRLRQELWDAVAPLRPPGGVTHSR
jgi:hypothetical protein